MICDLDARFTAPDGHADYDVADLAPRQLLQRTLARLQAAGYQARVAPELEFFLVHPERDAHGDAEQDLDIEVLQETHGGVRQG